MTTRKNLSMAIALALAASAAGVQALDFSNGEWTGSLDTTVSYGVSWRAKDPGDDQIGKANLNPDVMFMSNAEQRAAPGRWSVNGDDANLKWEKGDIVSNTVKMTSELSLNWRNFGAFLRGSAFYDFEYEDRDDMAADALDRVGSRARLLDAFVFWNFGQADGISGATRLGAQVVSWGESTFIQGGINQINPVDVSALRVAGSELKEAFLPVPMLWASFNLTDNLALEALYMFKFMQTDPEPVGSYFATNDFAPAGGRYAMLNFGTVPQPVINPDLFWQVCHSGPSGYLLSDRTDLSPTHVAAGCSAALPRAEDRRPSDSGQYGVALRYFAPHLGDTEFGLFYLRYHSRLPLLSGQSVTSSAPSSGRVIVEYPEDIDLIGISANTTLPWGLAFQGELSFKDGQPYQYDDVELLFAGLSPLNALIPEPGLRFHSQLGNFAPGEYIRGWGRHEVWQGQFTLTKVFGPGNILGSDQIASVLEVGATNVADLPGQDVLRYNGDGTDTGGGPDVSGGHLRNPITQEGGFPNRFSWGYRLAFRADYSNAFGSAFTLSPRVAFSHDVNGITPGPGANFIKDRKSYTVGMEANYLNQWALDMSYSRYFGAGMFNSLADRDFVSLSARYSF
ncbi:MAG: DUF1302 domain-containing protein [Xanthomonadales bacterium]|nr:DUF1302 domain-containing protein [Xanthomonadales bacterium]